MEIPNRWIGICLVLILPISLLINAVTDINLGAKIGEIDTTFGIQVLSSNGNIKTVTESGSYGSLNYYTLDWTAPDGSKVNAYRFIAIVTITGSGFPPNTPYNVYAKIQMDKIAQRHQSPTQVSYGTRTIERTGMTWKTDSQGKINKKIYFITSYEYTNMGDYDDSNLATANNLFWTHFTQPPAEIDETGEKLEYKGYWTIRVYYGSNPDVTKTGTTNVIFTYQAPQIQGNPTLQVNIDCVKSEWKLSLLSLTDFQISKYRIRIHWIYYLTTLIGIAFLVSPKIKI